MNKNIDKLKRCGFHPIVIPATDNHISEKIRKKYKKIEQNLNNMETCARWHKYTPAMRKNHNNFQRAF